MLIDIINGPNLNRPAPASRGCAPARRSKPMLIYIINGPNLNLLGTREPEIYGRETLEDIAVRCRERAGGHELRFLQSNYEGEIIGWIHEAIGEADALVINAGAYTHTSIAIHDALRAFHKRKIELHVSNPHLRESFRHVSYIAPVVDAVVAGLGVDGYVRIVELLCGTTR